MDEVLKNISDTPFLETGRLFVIPMATKDLVRFSGSIPGGFVSIPGHNDTISSFTANLLDAGTTKHSRDEIRAYLSRTGAKLSFSSGSQWTSFDGSCLPEDLPAVLELAAECIRDAQFPAADLQTLRTRRLSSLKDSSTNTSSQASWALSRLIYDSAHPHYVFEDDYYRKNYENISRKDLLAFRKIFSQTNMVVAISGDITHAKAARVAGQAFGSLQKNPVIEAVRFKNTKVATRQEKLISIPHKTNINVYMGAGIPLYYGDPLYYPSVLLMDMLGGGFTSHLMQTVRERDGLTYSIGAGIYSTGMHTDGYAGINAIFSPELYNKGVETIRNEIKVFLRDGITEDALARKKEEFIGSYPLSFSTTSGMVNKLATIGIRNQSLSEITEWIDHINGVTIAQLREAAVFIPFDRFSLAAAGTFAKKSK